VYLFLLRTAKYVWLLARKGSGSE